MQRFKHRKSGTQMLQDENRSTVEKRCFFLLADLLPEYPLPGPLPSNQSGGDHDWHYPIQFRAECFVVSSYLLLHFLSTTLINRVRKSQNPQTFGGNGVYPLVDFRIPILMKG